jgi:hypothetical protein
MVCQCPPKHIMCMEMDITITAITVTEHPATTIATGINV